MVKAKPDPVRWLKENLFSTPFNTVLTVVFALVIVFLFKGLIQWSLTQARWAVIPANFRLLMVGPYPLEQLWRIWTALISVSLAAGFSWGANSKGNSLPRAPFVLLAAIALLALVWQFGNPSGTLVPIACAGLVAGVFCGRVVPSTNRLHYFLWTALFFVLVIVIGADFGRGGVPSSLWGGLLLTVLLSVVSIVASFPLGVLLAIGRRSKLPVVSGFCIFFIEVVRGVPLIAVLFMAQLFVPFFFPPDFPQLDKVARAMIGMTLFSAAYMAENVRGGLQNVPSGQDEAARAIGLTATQTLFLIVLPQGLRAVIPTIVGQFIALFKDTSLVEIIGLTDLVGIGEAIRNNPDWLGVTREIPITLGVIYFVFTYSMSLAAKNLEKRLKTSN
jgi:general L-amino acid transport system permease protein